MFLLVMHANLNCHIFEQLAACSWLATLSGVTVVEREIDGFV